MVDKKTLIAYATKGMATEEAAELIAKILRNNYDLEVDLVDLRKDSPDIDKYENVVIGTGVRMQRVYKRGLKFMENDFSDKKVAVFLSSLEGGDEKSHDDAIKKYIVKEANKRLNVDPLASEAFGGRIRIFGFTLQDNIDRDKIEKWAGEIGEKFAE